jgi:hypothetical protein
MSVTKPILGLTWVERFSTASAVFSNLRLLP